MGLGVLIFMDDVVIGLHDDGERIAQHRGGSGEITLMSLEVLRRPNGPNEMRIKPLPGYRVTTEPEFLTEACVGKRFAARRQEDERGRGRAPGSWGRYTWRNSLSTGRRSGQ